MESNSELSVRLFTEGGRNCAQAVLSAFAERFGLSLDQAFQLAAPLGAGLGRSGEGACGAVSGALLVLGLSAGSLGRPEAETKEMAYNLAEEFLREFRRRHLSCNCKDLLGVHLGTEEGRHEAAERGLVRERCPRFVETAAETLEDILADLGIGPRP